MSLMILRRKNFGFVAAVLLFCCTAVSSQAPPDPNAVPGTGKLAKVTIQGSTRFPEEKVVAAAGLTLGQDVRREDMQAAADKLVATGLFQNVRYNFRSQKEKVDLTLQVDDAQLYPVFYDNFPWFTDDELNAAIRAAAPLFDGSLPGNGNVLVAASEALQKLLPRENINGAIRSEILGQIDGDGMMLRFTVEGPSLKIGAVQFQEKLAAGDAAVQTQAQELVGKPYSRMTIALFVREHVRPLYDERGHIRAAYPPPTARFTGDPNKRLPDNVTVFIAIEPGPVYRWGGVTWQGNSAFGPSALDSYVPFPPGEPANGVRLAKLWFTVLEEYGRRGYIEAKITPTPRFDDAQLRVHYEVKLQEGPLYRMGDLIITGLSALAKRKIEEAWTLEKGAIFNDVYFREFLASCESKKIFGDYVVHYDEVGHLLDTKPETKTVNVMLDFK